MCSQYIVTQRAINCLDFPTGDHSFADIYIVIFQNNMRLTAFNGGKAFKFRGNSVRQKKIDEFMWSNWSGTSKRTRPLESPSTISKIFPRAEKRVHHSTDN